MKSLVGAVVLVGVVAGVYVLNGIARDEQGRSVLHVAPALPISVEVASPARRDIIRIVQAPGDVEPLDEVDISAEVVAKIIEMPVEEGDRVNQGDLLCRLDDADYQARVTSAEAGVAKLEAMILQAEADHEKAERDFRRQVNLSEAEATSATELADYHTALIRARAALEIRRQELVETKAMLASAREDLRKTVITSPITGVISQLFAEQGEVVVTGTMNNPGTRIMVVSDLASMQVRCRVDEGDAALVKPDQVARIYLQSDTERSVPGRVLRVSPKGTKPTGREVVTFETLVLVESDDPRVKPGMSANVEIEVARSDKALSVPVEAIVHRKRRDLPEELVAQYDEIIRARTAVDRPRLAEYIQVAFRIDKEAAEPVLVETGISDEADVEVLSGLTDSDRVVIGPFRSLDQLKAGSVVKLSEEEQSSKKPVVAESEPSDGESESRQDSSSAVANKQ